LQAKVTVKIGSAMYPYNIKRLYIYLGNFQHQK